MPERSVDEDQARRFVLITRLLDGPPLPPAERQRVEAHLATAVAAIDELEVGPGGTEKPARTRIRESLWWAVAGVPDG